MELPRGERYAQGDCGRNRREGAEMKRIYLANPYGFSVQQKSVCLPQIIDALESLGVEVWEPFSRNDQVDFSIPGWSRAIGLADVRDVRNCDGIFAIVNGTPPDEGVMVELGIAMAIGKEVFLFRDDFRRCTDSEEYPLNLMLFVGLPHPNWRDHYYQSVAEITEPRGVALWARKL